MKTGLLWEMLRSWIKTKPSNIPAEIRYMKIANNLFGLAFQGK